MDELPKPMPAISVQQDSREDKCEKHGEYTASGFKLGKTVHWTGCPACREEVLQRERDVEVQRLLKMAEHQATERLDRAGIPKRYRSKDFGSFVADTDGKEKALSIAMEFAQNFEDHAKNGTVMVFSGLPGTGKSHLAIAIAQAVLATYRVSYGSAIDAVRAVRETWRKDSEDTEAQVLDRLSGVPLLVLDEVGVQYGTEAEQITLFDIIDKRYRDMMPTILLTNQNKAGMKAFLGDRSFDRLREGGIWVTFDWPSQRGAA